MLALADGILNRWMYQTGVMYFVAAAVVVVAAFAVMEPLLASYRKWRGKRLITCPETGRCEAVEVDAGRAAFVAVAGGSYLRLKECSRWPERRDCAQECLKQIERSPNGCLVRSILELWYGDKECVYCGRKLDEINWLEHRPALLAPDGTSREWSEFKPQTLPSVLATHQPVCWNCHIAETFRAEHPDLVTDRAWRR